MQPTTTDDRFRGHLHGMWAAVATSWAVHADDVDARAAAMTGAMLEGVSLRPGDRVLELACGPGGRPLRASLLCPIARRYA